MNQTDKHCLKKIIIFDNRTNTNQLTQTAKDNYNLITTKTYGDLLQKLSHIDISGAVIGLEHFLSENDNQNKNLTKYTNHRFPIIFISTDNSLNTHLKALKLGGEGFYNYPIKPSIFDRINDANCNNNSSCNALFICNKNNKWDEIISQMPTENFNIDFTSEKNAIDKISKNKPDVVITDMALENCSGLEMATIIRSFFDFTVNTPFIFLCEDSKLYSELECSNISNNKFITKPVSAERLVSALSRIIKRNLISNKYSPLLQRHDSITGLYDREYFLAEIEKAHATVKKDHSRKIDLVYILFQKTNSDSESKFSDEFMFKELASAAILKARDKDIYARYSDSVFCAIVHNRNNKELGEDIRLLLKEIKTKISKSDKYKIKDIIISVGISTFSPKLENEIETLSQAEIAANSVAESGGNGIKFYTAKKEQ